MSTTSTSTTSTSTTSTSTSTTSTSTTSTSTTSTSTTTTLAHDILSFPTGGIKFGMKEGINFVTEITPYISGKEQRASIWDSGLRTFNADAEYLSPTDMDTLWNKFISKKGREGVFLIKISQEYEVTTESVGTGDAAETTFLLDEFPVDTSANFTAYVAGSAVSATLTNNFATEKSYVVYGAAPGGSTALTVSYEFYFMVRFNSDAMTRELFAYQLLNGSLTFKEVRWPSGYTPRGGNA